MYGCESWTIKKAEYWRIDAFELWCWGRLLRVPWTVKEIQPVHPKGNRSWIFIGRTDAEAETPILWPLDAENWLIGKDPDAGKDWRREEKGTTENARRPWPQTWGSSSALLLRCRSLALWVATPDLGRGVTPHSHASVQSVAAGDLLIYWLL